MGAYNMKDRTAMGPVRPGASPISAPTPAAPQSPVSSFGSAYGQQGPAKPIGSYDRTLAPGLSNMLRGAGNGFQQPAAHGSESGPGYLESRYLSRLNGTDPAYEYATKRGGNELDARMSAGGSYNSGARGQQLSDFYANMAAQSQGQLDTLAGGASGEHQGKVNSSMMQGLQLAGGQAGLASSYDLGAAGNMQAAANAQQQMYMNKAGVDQQANQGLVNNGFSALKMYYGGGMGGGTGMGYTPAKV